MLKRIYYWTMNSWNREQAPAYNMKIYNLGLPHDEEMRLYGLLCTDGAFDSVEMLVNDFNREVRDHGYMAGFNGQSGGYLVLTKTHTNAGFDAKSVPASVLRAFRRLALDIRAEARYIAQNAKIEEYKVEHTARRVVFE